MRKFASMRSIIFIFSFILLGLTSCGNNGNTPPNVTANNSNSAVNKAKAQTAVPVYGYEIVNTYPHDPKAFTEGLFFHDGFLYESTGEERQSSLRRVDLKTGKVEQKFDMAPELFGEGIAI